MVIATMQNAGRRHAIGGSAAFALACAALLLLVTGAWRVLVVCDGPHDGPRVEWRHATGACADGACAPAAHEECCPHAAAAAWAGGGVAAVAPHCSDSLLAFPVASPPEPRRGAAPQAGGGDVPGLPAPAGVAAALPRTVQALATGSGPPPGPWRSRRLRGVLLLL
jgi:hypothetical protein